MPSSNATNQDPPSNAEVEAANRLLDVLTGFSALMVKVDDLAKRNAELERQLQAYKNDSNRSLGPASDSLPSNQADNEHKGHADWRQEKTIARGITAFKLLQQDSDTADSQPDNSAPPPVANGVNGHSVSEHGALEQDYTTPGTPGRLACPFASMDARDTTAANGHPSALPTPPEHAKDPAAAASAADDPIAADRCAAPSSVGGSHKCPIRFLDAHSPDEVAAYFERHKAELPRSHAVCMRRYSADAARAARIDARYGGNLAHLLQGLGHKHQPLLPPEARSAEAGSPGVAGASTGGSSRRAISVVRPERVEAWAETCAAKKAEEEAAAAAGDWTSELRAGADVDVDADAGDDDDDDGERTPHFARPLQDVRLGESPSRPWGIQVPEAQEPTPSAAEEGGSHGFGPRSIPETVGGRSSPLPAEAAAEVGDANFSLSSSRARSPARSPVGEKSVPEVYPVSGSGLSLPAKKELVHEPRKAGPGTVIFNGPVFLGYSAEDASALLQSFTKPHA